MARNDEERPGTTYVRWGRTSCEGSATLVYKGLSVFCDTTTLRIIFTVTLKNKKAQLTQRERATAVHV